MDKKKILIADDDPKIVKALTIRFGHEGFDVVKGIGCLPSS